MTFVGGYGPQPARIMLVGESPGINEAKLGRPFVGKSGQDQDWYAARHGIDLSDCYMTNVRKEFIKGNPDPTVAEIEYWSPVLEWEVKATRPQLIVAVGRFAAQWFLGELTMEACHGIVHRGGCFDPAIAHRSCGVPVVPIYHPAVGLYDSNMKATCDYDYAAVARTLEQLDANIPLVYPEDPYAGHEHYVDVTGAELDSIISARHPRVISLDTEGYTHDPWSLQVSFDPGEGYVLRYAQPDFAAGIAALQQCDALWVMHHAMHDVEMCRVMGLELRNARWWDTMYAAYILRQEPQGLKPLAWRWCGMKMGEYMDTVGDVGRELQLDYLRRIAESDLPRLEKRLEIANDGVGKLKQPQAVQATAKRIIHDVVTGKVTKEGPTDPEKRWRNVDERVREQAEAEFGPMPIGTLAHVPLDEAIHYSARDSDASLRLYYRLRDELERRGLTRLMSDGMDTLPIFEEIQYTGMPASRPAFEQLRDQMTDEMLSIGWGMSSKYFDNQPFNPKSSPQVRKLMAKRGIKGLEITKGGEISTGKKSIEYMRGQDPAISDLFDWRERQHVRDTFCKPYLKHIPPGQSIGDVRCTINTTRVETRRLSSKNPNLLAVSARTELGLRVRHCFHAPEGYVFGSWDFGQIEARYLAHVSQDDVLVSTFKADGDVYRETASRIFGVPLAEVTKRQRSIGKTITLGTAYGIQSHALMVQLRMQGIEVTENEAQDYLNRWYKVHYGVAEYKAGVVAETEQTGYSEDYWGMRRYLPGIWHYRRGVRSEAQRASVSQRIQGGAQGMIQRSMAWLRPHITELQRDHDVRWRLQLHDEILLTFPEGLWDTINPLVLEAFTEHCGIELSVPVKADGVMGKTWGEAK